MRDKDERTLNLPTFESTPGAVAIDLDGTLLNSRSQLSERNRLALDGCIARGIPIIIATSRPARTTRRLFGDELLNRCSLVLMNGAFARAAPPLSGIIRETLPSAVIKDIIRLTLDMEPEARVTLELDGYEFGTNRPRDPDELWKVNAATPDMQLSLEQALSGSPSKIAVGGLGRDLSTVADEISRQFGDLLSVVPANERTFLNITSTRATKPETLRRLLYSRQISMSDVVAIGDDIPDLGMLIACGISIAVANAVPEVMAAAKYQTANNDDDGVAIVLEWILKAADK
jgi:Cof subfamily protein (haloacid dehalogenase superfamily)